MGRASVRIPALPTDLRQARAPHRGHQGARHHITVRPGCGECGYPAALLSDNAAVFSGASRRGKVLIESQLERLGIRCIHSTPYHPQTCGKVERFHQTLKKYLAKQVPPASLGHLQLQLDTYRPTTTSTGRTGRSVDARRWSRSPRGSKPDRPRCRRPCTSGSERTASTPVGRSPCATTASSGTSRSAGPTRTNRSGCSSPMTTFGSLARRRTAPRADPRSELRLSATRSPDRRQSSMMSGDRCPRSPETRHLRGGRDSNPRSPCGLTALAPRRTRPDYATSPGCQRSGQRQSTGRSVRHEAGRVPP